MNGTWQIYCVASLVGRRGRVKPQVINAASVRQRYQIRQPSSFATGGAGGRPSSCGRGCVCGTRRGLMSWREAVAVGYLYAAPGVIPWTNRRAARQLALTPVPQLLSGRRALRTS